MSKRRRQLPPQQNPLIGEIAPPPEKQFYTVGFICGVLQQSPAAVIAMMRIAEVGFAFAENGVGFIRGDDLQKMAATLKDKRAEVEAAAFN